MKNKSKKDMMKEFEFNVLIDPDILCHNLLGLIKEIHGILKAIQKGTNDGDIQDTEAFMMALYEFTTAFTELRQEMVGVRKKADEAMESRRQVAETMIPTQEQ